jgi:hypothetical protein
VSDWLASSCRVARQARALGLLGAQDRLGALAALLLEAVEHAG